MREINTSEIGERLLSLLKEESPIDEDIGIVDGSGNVLGVVVTEQVYKFFSIK